MRTWAKRMIALCALIPLVLLTALAYLLIPPLRGPAEAVAESGSLHDVMGMRVLCLQGTPYAMGYEYGRLLKPEIAQMFSAFQGRLDQMAREELGVSPWLAKRFLDAVYRCTGPHIPLRYRRELEGLADGSGIRLQDLRRVHILSVVTERNCSSFAVFGKATLDGKVYHSRNFDWSMDLGLQDHPILVVYKGMNRVPFVNIGYVGLIGCLSGMNSEGISVGHIGAVSSDKSLFGTPMPFLLRRVLEESTSTDAAARILVSARRTVGDNYVIADGKARDAVAVETCHSRSAVFRDNDPREAGIEYAIRIEDAVFRADEAMDPDVRRRQRCANGYPNLPYGSNSYDHRYRGMAERIQANYGRIDQAIAEGIVRATAMTDCNLHWVLYAPSDLEFWVAHAKGTEDASRQPAARFDLSELLSLFNSAPQ